MPERKNLSLPILFCCFLYDLWKFYSQKYHTKKEEQFGDMVLYLKYSVELSLGLCAGHSSSSTTALSLWTLLCAHADCLKNVCEPF